MVLHMDGDRVECVGALVYDDEHRLLLVQRANEPGRGLWSLPGGRVEPGEDDSTALTREVAEETGLAVEVGSLVGEVERDAPGGRLYVIRDYEAVPVGGVLTAGDDASAAKFVSREEFENLPTTTLLASTLAQWNALPG
ncbi:ADP-ribose pyrophosphatase YjhB (NUDIX family) [Kribbella voronezhensis]|uniref:ADP-ribose pyrophosphatase YjhB (NUDIX family) n=2 Tax=Kribbellaceae TaxID=2726069 RepID=A0A4R7TH24_9ACTN|nr:ADP-ribose pyrophosphatase YjhB (NUDIX family) [Kribbella voronezhensis]